MSQRLVSSPGRAAAAEPLSSFWRISQAMASGREPKGILHLVLEESLQETGGDAGSLMLLDPGSGRLSIEAARGLPPGVAGLERPGLGEGIAGRVAQEGTPLLVNDDEAVRALVQREPRCQTGSALCVPLQVGGQTIGVLNVSRRRQVAPFTQQDLHLLMIFAGFAAATIQQLRLQEEVASKEAQLAARDEELQGSHLMTARALAACVAQKDVGTAGHLERLPHLALRLARRLGIPEEVAEDLYLAALLHDVGKIGVADAILTKPGPLSPAEWQEMRQHPILGEQVLATVPGLSRAAQIVRHHHERYDGSGYPDGLQGEAIPLEARLLAVVDAFDAMCSERPYRPRLSLHQAQQELEKGMGTQFDLAIAKAFLALLRQEGM